MTAATREDDFLRRELPPIASAAALREITVLLRRIATMTSIAPDPSMRMNIVLPELGNPIVECGMAFQALPARKVLAPDFRSQCQTRRNESAGEDLRHAKYPR